MSDKQTIDKGGPRLPILDADNLENLTPKPDYLDLPEIQSSVLVQSPSIEFGEQLDRLLAGRREAIASGEDDGPTLRDCALAAWNDVVVEPQLTDKQILGIFSRAGGLKVAKRVLSWARKESVVDEEEARAVQRAMKISASGRNGI